MAPGPYVWPGGPQALVYFQAKSDRIVISEGWRLYQLIELLKLLREGPDSGSNVFYGPRIHQTSGRELFQMLYVGLAAPSKLMFKLTGFIRVKLMHHFPESYIWFKAAAYSCASPSEATFWGDQQKGACFD